ncbi:MAG TPA: hypothetical protein EYO73_04835 [Sulfurimonas sp.]|nr:hypothetical protein [Sulfurimonas sp.]
MMFKKFNIVKNDYNSVKKLHYTPPKERYLGEPERSESSKLELGYVSTKTSEGISFGIKPILFNRIDDHTSKINESTLEFLSFEINHIAGTSQLEKFDFFNIESITKRFDFYSTPSWKLRTGADRRLDDTKLHDVVQLAVGGATGTLDFMGYGMIQTSMYPSELNIGVDLLAGISYWIGDIHLGIDFDIPLAYTTKDANYNYETYFVLPMIKNKLKLKGNIQHNIMELAFLYYF